MNNNFLPKKVIGGIKSVLPKTPSNIARPAKIFSPNELGAIKRKLGLRGPTQPGQMIERMNAIKNSIKVGKAAGMAGKVIKKFKK